MKKNLIIIFSFLLLAMIFLSFTVEKSPNLSPEGTVKSFQKAYEEKDFNLFKQLFAESYMKETFPDGEKDMRDFLTVGNLEFTDIHTIKKEENKAKIGFTTNFKNGEYSNENNWEITMQLQNSKWLIYKMNIN